MVAVVGIGDAGPSLSFLVLGARARLANGARAARGAMVRDGVARAHARLRIAVQPVVAVAVVRVRIARGPDRSGCDALVIEAHERRGALPRHTVARRVEP